MYKKLRRTFTIFFLAFSIILNLWQIKAYAAGTNIIITSDKAQYNVGDTVTLTIQSQVNSKIFGVQFTLNYDPSSLQLQRDNITFLEGYGPNYSKIDENKGEITYAATESAIDTENEKIVKISFTAAKKGTVNLNLTNIKAVDKNTNIVSNNTTYQSSIGINVVPVSGIEINASNMNMFVGDTRKLNANVIPSNATNKNITWQSSNQNVATVDQSGNVTAVGAGKADITVTSVDGNKTAICSVDVANRSVAVTGVNLNKDSMTLKVGESDILVATILPNNASNKSVTWSSSNSEIVTVDQNGKITAKNKGVAIITVATEVGKYTDSCTVTVEDSKTGNDDLPKTGSPLDLTILILFGIAIISIGALVASHKIVRKKEQ